MKRDLVDFFLVEPHQLAIHARLEGWARWVRVRPAGWQTHPMFRQYRSHAWQWETPEIRPQMNTLEAHETEKAVSQLPEKHRDAIRWAYVLCSNPTGMAKRLAVTKQGLMGLIQDGRSMLRNRLLQNSQPKG